MKKLTCFISCCLLVSAFFIIAVAPPVFSAEPGAGGGAPEPPKRKLPVMQQQPQAQTPIGPETCWYIDSNKLTIVGRDSQVDLQSGAPGTWLLKLSSSKSAFVLAYSDTKADAERIIFLIKARHWNRVCVVGNRGGASFHYMLSEGE